jgi:hypothetical protein
MFKKIFIIGSLVVLTLATFGVTFSHVALLPLGVALFVASFLVD